MKLKAKIHGLINISGFHVDPGFSGKLVFSVFNAGVHDMHISVGSPLFVIWYAYLDSATSGTYTGSHMGQSSIPDGYVTNLAAKIPSPQSLEKDLQEVRRSLEQQMRDMQHELDKRMENNKTLLATFLTIAGSVLILVIGIAVKGCTPVESKSAISMPEKITLPVTVVLDSGSKNKASQNSGATAKPIPPALGSDAPSSLTKIQRSTSPQSSTPTPFVNPTPNKTP